MVVSAKGCVDLISLGLKTISRRLRSIYREQIHQGRERVYTGERENPRLTFILFSGAALPPLGRPQATGNDRNLSEMLTASQRTETNAASLTLGSVWANEFCNSQ